jgi:hypothetical protein
LHLYLKVDVLSVKKLVKEGKLRTYLKIKTNFGYENYLSIIKHFEQRRRLSKLRISAHKLQIEIGRYQGTLRENHQGTMPKRIFSFSCSMQVIQFADLQFHLIK